MLLKCHYWIIAEKMSLIIFHYLLCLLQLVYLRKFRRRSQLARRENIEDAFDITSRIQFAGLHDARRILLRRIGDFRHTSR